MTPALDTRQMLEVHALLRRTSTIVTTLNDQCRNSNRSKLLERAVDRVGPRRIDRCRL